ncbi:unnamed protein product [Clonostachys solani]|uniref:Xylose isomerase-like TIM barrel domain-containing protein n=1 Tax=Clonostachys solani TaxID=160281 RepID=A0A9P0ENN0_9HYPO|nr:unnamed protein product [Clonostachys solani]
MAFKPAIMSVSLGRGWLHDFDEKMEQAAKAGFQGIEMFVEDIEYLARKIANKAASEEPTASELLTAAKHARATCDKNNLVVITLQPFSFYEGLLDRKQHRYLLDTKLKLWFQMAKIFSTTMIQIPANFLPASQITSDRDVIVADLQELADLGAAENPPVEFAYENLCWSTYNSTWQDVWEIVRRVDRPNFGLCLDTFNIAGRVWADPTSPSGKNPNADQDFRRSMAELVSKVDLKKVFYIQVVDAERMDAPLIKGHPFHVDEQPPRMSWSRNARCFMYEYDRGAYLPSEEVARAIIDGLGYKGWVSMELFSRTMAYEGAHIPAEHAQRGIKCWKTFVKRFGIQLEAHSIHWDSASPSTTKTPRDLSFSIYLTV